MSHNEMMAGFAVEIELNYDVTEYVTEELTDNFDPSAMEQFQIFYDYMAEKVLCLWLTEYQYEYLGSSNVRITSDELLVMEIEFIDWLNKHGDVKGMKTNPTFFQIAWYNGSDMDAIL